MSLFSLTSLAIARDIAGPGEPVPSGRPGRQAVAQAVSEAAARRGAAAAGPGQPTPIHADPSGSTTAGSVAGFAELLVAQIPSEALLAYTTLLALFSVGGSSYNTGRWILYGAAIFACAATVMTSYLAQRNYGFDDTARDAGTPATSPGRHSRRTHLPYLPTFTAVMSMAVYGLTVPGSPLQYDLSGPGFGILSGCLAVAGGVMMAAIAPFLGKGNGGLVTPGASRPVTDRSSDHSSPSVLTSTTQEAE